MNARFIPLFIIGAMTVMITRRVSAAGLNTIKQHEALRLAPYRDAGGLWTVGWGHLIRDDESRLHNGITVAEAEALLRADLAQAEQSVRNTIKVPVSDNQFDALVSLAYNIGAAAFAGSTLARKLNAGDVQGAAGEFTRWDKVQGRVVAGLAVRRAAEQRVFLS